LQLVAAKILTSPLATDAMRRTDRQVYCTVKGWVRDPPTRKSVQASDAGSTNDNTQSGGGGGSELQSQQSSGVARQGKSSAYAYGPYADAPQAIGFKVNKLVSKPSRAIVQFSCWCTLFSFSHTNTVHLLADTCQLSSMHLL